MTNIELIEKIKSKSDPRLKEFSNTILKTNKKLYGLSVPQMKEIAKELVKDSSEDYMGFAIDSYEENVIINLAIAYSKKDYLEKLKIIAKRLEKADSWAEVDTIVSALKINKKVDKEKVKDFIAKNVESKHTFVRRFSYVLSINLFTKDAEDLSYIFNLYKEDKEYYVKMAQAWFYATAYIYNPSLVLKLLDEKKVDIEVRKMLLRKILDSFRIKEEEKEKSKKIL